MKNSLLQAVKQGVEKITSPTSPTAPISPVSLLAISIPMLTFAASLVAMGVFALLSVTVPGALAAICLISFIATSMVTAMAFIPNESEKSNSYVRKTQRNEKSDNFSYISGNMKKSKDGKSEEKNQITRRM